MPNYCYNTLTLVGHKEDLENIKEHNLSFRHFVPAEEDIDKQRAAWGTKWEAFDIEVHVEDENVLVYKFTTAWCPPITFLEKLNGLFPRMWIKLQWREETGISGIWIRYIKNGIVMNPSFEWEEPPAYLTEDGEIALP